MALVTVDERCCLVDSFQYLMTDIYISGNFNPHYFHKLTLSMSRRQLFLLFFHYNYYYYYFEWCFIIVVDYLLYKNVKKIIEKHNYPEYLADAPTLNSLENSRLFPLYNVSSDQQFELVYVLALTFCFCDVHSVTRQMPFLYLCPVYLFT